MGQNSMIVKNVFLSWLSFRLLSFVCCSLKEREAARKINEAIEYLSRENAQQNCEQFFARQF